MGRPLYPIAGAVQERRSLQKSGSELLSGASPASLQKRPASLSNEHKSKRTPSNERPTLLLKKSQSRNDSNNSSWNSGARSQRSPRHHGTQQRKFIRKIPNIYPINNHLNPDAIAVEGQRSLAKNNSDNQFRITNEYLDLPQSSKKSRREDNERAMPKQQIAGRKEKMPILSHQMKRRGADWQATGLMRIEDTNRVYRNVINWPAERRNSEHRSKSSTFDNKLSLRAAEAGAAEGRNKIAKIAVNTTKSRQSKMTRSSNSKLRKRIGSTFQVSSAQLQANSSNRSRGSRSPGKQRPKHFGKTGGTSASPSQSTQQQFASFTFNADRQMTQDDVADLKHNNSVDYFVDEDLTKIIDTGREEQTSRDTLRMSGPTNGARR